MLLTGRRLAASLITREYRQWQIHESQSDGNESENIRNKSVDQCGGAGQPNALAFTLEHHEDAQINAVQDHFSVCSYNQ